MLPSGHVDSLEPAGELDATAQFLSTLNVAELCGNAYRI
jgi:hypothetical protein